MVFYTPIFGWSRVAYRSNWTNERTLPGQARRRGRNEAGKQSGLVQDETVTLRHGNMEHGTLSLDTLHQTQTTDMGDMT